MGIHVETRRLILRDWQASDFDAFAKMNADKEVMRYFPEPLTEKQTRTYYDAINEELSEYGFGFYATEEKSSGDFIGFIGFHRANFDVDFCPCNEIGWRLKKEHWGKGYATEGARGCLKHGFDKLNFYRVYSFTAISNLPSQGVMKKIGMKVFEHFDHPALPDKSVLRPHVCFVIDRTQFEKMALAELQLG